MTERNKGGRPRHDPPLARALLLRLEQTLFDALHARSRADRLATQELIRRVLRAELRRNHNA